MSGGRKILVVDDEDDVRMFLEDFLSERDLLVETASNGDEALRKAAVFHPDVVLLDVMMPGIDGMECLQKLKEKYPKISVIMLTALKDETRMEKAKKLGAYDYIVKPFSLDYLEKQLVKLVEEAS